MILRMIAAKRLGLKRGEGGYLKEIHGGYTVGNKYGPTHEVKQVSTIRYRWNGFFMEYVGMDKQEIKLAL